MTAALHRCSAALLRLGAARAMLQRNACAFCFRLSHSSPHAVCVSLSLIRPKPPSLPVYLKPEYQHDSEAAISDGDTLRADTLRAHSTLSRARVPDTSHSFARSPVYPNGRARLFTYLSSTDWVELVARVAPRAHCVLERSSTHGTWPRSQLGQEPFEASTLLLHEGVPGVRSATRLRAYIITARP